MLDIGALLLVFYAYSSWLCAFFGAYFIRGNNYFGANIYTFCVSAVRWLQRHRATPHNCVAVFLVESHWTGVISQSREYIYPQQQQHQGIEHWRRRRRLGCHRSQAGLMKRQSYRVISQTLSNTWLEYVVWQLNSTIFWIDIFLRRHLICTSSEGQGWTEHMSAIARKLF